MFSLCQPVYKSLYHFRGQPFQPDAPQSGLYVVSNLSLIARLCQGLHPFQVCPCPGIHPLSNRQFGRVDVYPQINRRRGCLELLSNLLLRLAGNAPLHLLAGTGVISSCKPCLPIGILFPRAGHGLFTDGPRACRRFSAHVPLLSSCARSSAHGTMGARF